MGHVPWPVWLPARLLTIKETAKVLNVSERSVWRLIRSGKISVVHIGDATRITPETLAALLGFNEQ